MTKKRVLIVDDEDRIRELFTDYLALSEYYEVAGEAKNGKEALEKYKELKPDIVTMDIMMPVIDGLQATQDILNYDPNAKVIIASVMEEEKIATQYRTVGACGYVRKPFLNANNIFNSLDKALGIQSAEGPQSQTDDLMLNF